MTGNFGSRKVKQECHYRTRQAKKRIGSFYTPIELARLIAYESLDAWLERKKSLEIDNHKEIHRYSEKEKKYFLTLINDLKILDPTVGDGVFLLAAAEWMEEKQRIFSDRRSPESRRKDIVEKSLFGVDISAKAVKSCRARIKQWYLCENKKLPGIEMRNIHVKQGNSLVGTINEKDLIKKIDFGFNWNHEFPDVMTRENPGFDMILGNPPYGNILHEREREYIEDYYPFMVGKNRDGTWNSAAHFIVRSKMLLRHEGELAFLIPNSILRVNQFTKTRDFLLEKMLLWKIIDEGSPFEDVTLEMVSVFCRNDELKENVQIDIESRRLGHETVNKVSRDLLRTCKVFPIYHDSLFSAVLKKGKRNFMIASRGRDIPKDHVVNDSSSKHRIPYITSGRSVQRYHIDRNNVSYTDDWFLQDCKLKQSYQTELLVATKNYRYPRCIIKPIGTIHGGGIVEIIPHSDEVNKKALGFILNSHLIRYLSIRYLTNYSQLTTCLNTGILEDLPIVESNYQDVYEFLFDELSKLYQNTKQNGEYRDYLEKLSDALVYELYFGSNDTLNREVAGIIRDEISSNQVSSISDKLKTERIANSINAVLELSDVKRVEKELRTFN